ncbi:hypothetical protein ACHAXH_009481 [Discostella pseudostelligera]
MTMEVEDDNATPSATAAAYLSSLPEPLRGFAIRALAPPDSNGENCREEDGGSIVASSASTSTATTSAPVDRVDEFEISTRSHLLTLAEQLLSFSTASQETQNDEDGIIDALLQYLKNVTILCLHVVKHHAANPPPPNDNDTTETSNNYYNYSHLSTTLPLKKLPFLLIEDAFDTLPLSIIQTLWSSSQHPHLNLSSYATSLLCSPTIFVPPSKFVLLRICNKLLKQLSNTQKAEDAEFAGSIMILLAKVFPLSERSAVNVLGSYNVRKSTGTETTSLLENEMCERLESGAEQSVGSGSAGVSGEFYKTFWGVQKVFTDPPGTILPTQLSQAAAADAYGSFMKDITSILMALESTPLPKVTTTATTINAIDDGNALSVRHHKYLTSRQLLHLQLKDAQLRVHFLTQLLIVLSHLASPNVTLPVPSLTSDGSKATVQARVAEQSKQLSQVEKRGMELLRATLSSPSTSSLSGGRGTMCKFLSWILKDRESMWRSWKRAKCMPALEKVGNVTTSGSVIQDMLSVGKKRKADSAALEDGADSEKRRLDASGGMIQISTLPDITGQITQALPTLDSFLNPYVEALDPENGIEGEYHPRNDKVYCWRALRLMARDQNHLGQLCRFGKLRRRDGDFEGIVRDMWKAEKEGEEIGGTLDDADYYADEIDLNDTCNEAAGGSGIGDNDVEMLDDAASVGTPEEDAEARREKMAEFEQAAMEVEENMLNEDEEKLEEKKEQVEPVNTENKTDGVLQNSGQETKGNITTSSNSDVAKDNKLPAKVVTNNSSTQPAPKDSKGEETKEGIESSNGKGSVVKAAQPKGNVNINGNVDKSAASAAVSSSNYGNDQNNHNGNQKKDDQKKDENKSTAPARPKFTPPQKKQQQQQTKVQIQAQPQKNEPSRVDSRGRFVGRRDNNADQVPQQQPQQQHQSRIPPPQNHSQRSGVRDGGGGRQTHQRGNSANDASQDATKRRDGKSQSPPPNKANDGGPPRGGGLGNKGKSGWEPPPPSQGASGRGAGGGKGGGGDGHGGSYRERRHGGGGRR